MDRHRHTTADRQTVFTGPPGEERLFLENADPSTRTIRSAVVAPGTMTFREAPVTAARGSGAPVPAAPGQGRAGRTRARRRCAPAAGTGPPVPNARGGSWQDRLERGWHRSAEVPRRVLRASPPPPHDSTRRWPSARRAAAHR